MNSSQQGVRNAKSNNSGRRSNFSLSDASFGLILRVGFLVASQQAAADPSILDQQKQNRSRFEYHDGRAYEQRPYRRPDLDIDPTNLMMEELRERINALEERLEQIENRSNALSKGR